MWSPAVLRIVAAVCAYEAVALLRGGWPTVTSLSRESMLFRALVLGGLAYHFRRVAQEISDPDGLVS